MVCEESTLTYRTGRNNTESATAKTWLFTLRDKDGNKVDNNGKRLLK